MSIYKTLLREEFTESNFHPIRNRQSIVNCKPSGGLWVSTADEDGVTPWHSFVEGSSVAEYDVELEENASIVFLETNEQYMELIDVYGHQPELDAENRMTQQVLFSRPGNSHFLRDSIDFSYVTPGLWKKQLDYEKLAEDYDGLFVGGSLLHRSFSYYEATAQSEDDVVSFNGWDVPTLLLFNLFCASVTPSEASV